MTETTPTPPAGHPQGQTGPAPSARDGWTLESFQKELTRLFSEFPWTSWRPPLPFPLPRGPVEFEPLWRTESRFGPAPAVDVAETDGSYEVSAELPGVAADGIQVSLSNGALTIKGEKKEEPKKNYYVSERHYGTFQRTLRVPQGIDENRIEAGFAGGVLTVILPKVAEARKEARTIPVQHG